MIDFHCHLLPGLDDGPATMDEAVKMAAAMQNAGFTTVYCTPHLIKGTYDADNKAVIASLTSLQKRLKDENIDLHLLPGREYYLDEYLDDYLKDPLACGETRFILIEIPNHSPEQFVKETCLNVLRSGFIPMIAHPERCDLFAVHSPFGAKLTKLFSFNSKNSNQNSKLLFDLLNLGCNFQANLGSFAAWYGPQVHKTANRLKEMEVYTHFGTDLHSPSGLKTIRNIALSNCSFSS